MHNSRVEKVPTESQGDEAPIIHSVQAPSAEADVARASRLSATNAIRVTMIAPRLRHASRPGPRTCSLDHLIRPLEERRRDRQAEGLGGPEVDDQLELGWPLHRQISGLGTPKNLDDVSCRAAIRIRHRSAIRHQAPCVYASS